MHLRIAMSKAALAVGLIASPLCLDDLMAKEQPDMPVDETSGTNQAFSFEVTTSASPDQIWTLWTDVSTWKNWDKGLKDAELVGPMQVGSKGKIIPPSGPSASFEVTEFEPKTSYTFVTNLPLAKLTIERSIIGTSPTRFRHDVSFSGISGKIFARQLGPGFRAALPPTMREIARLAEDSATDAP